MQEDESENVEDENTPELEDVHSETESESEIIIFKRKPKTLNSPKKRVVRISNVILKKDKKKQNAQDDLNNVQPLNRRKEHTFSHHPSTFYTKKRKNISPNNNTVKRQKI